MLLLFCPIFLAVVGLLLESVENLNLLISMIAFRNNVRFLPGTATYGNIYSLQDINGHKLNVEFTRIPRPEDRGRERRRRQSPLRDRDRDRDRGSFGYRDGGFRDTRGGGYYDPPPRLGPDMGPYGPPSSFPPLTGGFQGLPPLGGPPPNSRRMLLDTPSKSQHPGAGGGYGPGPGGPPPPSRGGYGASQPPDDMGYGRGPPPESGPPGRDSYGPPPSRRSYTTPGKC